MYVNKSCKFCIDLRRQKLGLLLKTWTSFRKTNIFIYQTIPSSFTATCSSRKKNTTPSLKVTKNACLILMCHLVSLCLTMISSIIQLLSLSSTQLLYLRHKSRRFITRATIRIHIGFLCYYPGIQNH